MRVCCQETEAEIQEELDILMRSDIMAAQMSTKHITFSRAQSGWLFREDKTVGYTHCSPVCVDVFIT